jgi:hypothetical protein
MRAEKPDESQYVFGLCGKYTLPHTYVTFLIEFRRIGSIADSVSPRL